jgi:nucleoside-diphosphate-sugar epimerase
MGWKIRNRCTGAENLMKVLITGAAGFVGRHVVPELLKRRHDVIAVDCDLEKAKGMQWYKKVTFHSNDIFDQKLDHIEEFGMPDVMIHLAWPGLPNYKDLFHFEKNLPNDYNFIKKMVMAGVRHVLVTGTCFEYGIQNGQLSEETITMPSTPYGLAKDTLRKFLQELQKTYQFRLQWVRLFYMYGVGQNPKSLLAQLDHAIDNKEISINMSGGEQLRDYMSIEEVAHNLVSLIEHPECSGIINCCSGKPISVRNLVEKRIAERGANINLNLGYYPYPDYEPMAFWGSNDKMKSIIDNEQGK